LIFRAGEETLKAEAGSFLFIPSGVIHTFSNRSLVAWHRSIDYPSLPTRLDRWRSG
jgi:quercetin dioxygenase-like cupin family protein